MRADQALDDAIHIVFGRASPSYVIGGASLVVVDVGFPSDARNVLRHVASTLGRDTKDIRLVVLTHSHFDHINGVDYLVGKTGASIAAHVEARKHLTGERALPIISCREAREFLLFLWKQRFPRPSIRDVTSMPWAGIPGVPKGISSTVQHWLVDGQKLSGHPQWEVIHTPGHTDDSICLYNSQHKALLTGDTIINLDGRLRLNPLLEVDPKALRASLEKLKERQVDSVYPGWGPPVVGKDVLSSVDMETVPE